MSKLLKEYIKIDVSHKHDIQIIDLNKQKIKGKVGEGVTINKIHP